MCSVNRGSSAQKAYGEEAQEQIAQYGEGNLYGAREAEEFMKCCDAEIKT